MIARQDSSFLSYMLITCLILNVMVVSLYLPASSMHMSKNSSSSYGGEILSKMINMLKSTCSLVATKKIKSDATSGFGIVWHLGPSGLLCCSLTFTCYHMQFAGKQDSFVMVRNLGRRSNDLLQLLTERNV